MKGITVVKKRPDCYRSTHTWNVQILSAEFPLMSSPPSRFEIDVKFCFLFLKK